MIKSCIVNGFALIRVQDIYSSSRATDIISTITTRSYYRFNFTPYDGILL